MDGLCGVCGLCGAGLSQLGFPTPSQTPFPRPLHREEGESGWSVRKKKSGVGEGKPVESWRVIFVG